MTKKYYQEFSGKFLRLTLLDAPKKALWNGA